MSLEKQAAVSLIFEKKVSGNWIKVASLSSAVAEQGWENREGGGGDMEETKHYEGGMGKLLSFVASETIDNVTVAKRYDPETMRQLFRDLMANRGCRVTVAEQDMDEFKVGFENPHTWTGKLKKVEKGNTDAQGTNVRMLTLEISAYDFA